MHAKLRSQITSLRFRRWSRKGYAVFCSLTCSVSIGALAVAISNKTLQKSSAVSVKQFSVSASDALMCSVHGDGLELEAIENQLIQLVTLPLSLESVAAAVQEVLVFCINIFGWIGFAQFNRFFYPSI